MINAVGGLLVGLIIAMVWGQFLVNECKTTQTFNRTVYNAQQSAMALKYPGMGCNETETVTCIEIQYEQR